MQPVPTKVPPTANFHCDICSRATPLHEPHRCEGLTPRQLRKLSAQKRLNAVRRVQANRPTRCPDCAQEMYPAGWPHACRARTTDAALVKARSATSSGLVGELKRLGVKFEKD